MSEARTPEEDIIDRGDAPDPAGPDLHDEPYHGPDPEADEKGDGADEDQGT